MSPTVIRGFERGVGVLEDDLDVAPRTGGAASRSSRRGPRPRRCIEPDGRLDQPHEQPASVDLPQPDSPTSPRVSPRRRSRSTPSTALTVPDRLLEDDALGDREVLTMTSTAAEDDLAHRASRTSSQKWQALRRPRGDLVRAAAGRPGRRPGRSRSAGWKVQPGGMSVRFGGRPLDGGELRALQVDPRDRLQQRLRVGVRRAGRRSS